MFNIKTDETQIIDTCKVIVWFSSNAYYDNGHFSNQGRAIGQCVCV